MKNPILSFTFTFVLAIIFLAQSYVLFDASNQIKVLTHLHDEDLNALIELDQFYQKKLHHKRKIKPCFVYEVSHVA